jgi:hypothetical protein
VQAKGAPRVFANGLQFAPAALPILDPTILHHNSGSKCEHLDSVNCMYMQTVDCSVLVCTCMICVYAADVVCRSVTPHSLSGSQPSIANDVEQDIVGCTQSCIFFIWRSAKYY